jgi:hypothetical protein
MVSVTSAVTWSMWMRQRIGSSDGSSRGSSAMMKCVPERRWQMPLRTRVFWPIRTVVTDDVFWAGGRICSM